MEAQKLEMVYWPIEKLTRYKNNTKTHPDTQVDKIAESIKNFRFDQPIAVDTDGIIIKGHGRLLAAIKLGMKEVPVIVRNDLTLHEAAASRIADNRVAESPWDENFLAIEFAELEAADFDLLVTGFDSKEINKLLGNLTFSSDSSEGGESNDSSLEDEENSHVKMIQLFYNQEDETNFRSLVAFLEARLKTENISDTVYNALELLCERIERDKENLCQTADES